MSFWLALAINVAVIGLIAYAAYMGTKRGLVLLALEFVSFVIATILALLLYHPVSSAFQWGLRAAEALSNVTGFIVVWTLTEILCAIAIRRWVLPHIGHHVHLSLPNRIGGGVVGALKSAFIITLGLIVLSHLPLPVSATRPVLQAYLPAHMLASSGGLRNILDDGLGRDFSDSLSFFTVPAEPENEKRIDLGFTTTNVTVAPKAETDMLVLLNKERTSRGFKPLTLNTGARAVARKYSADMFARGYFSHVNPEGKSPFDRMSAGGVRYLSAGENLALAPTMAQAHTGLMNSPGHKANILSPDFRTVGIGIVDGGQYGVMVTQDFTN